ncbi:MAG: lantibiotic modifying enzyme [Salibacteraceae bacterium]|jgi:lantibiotic modifying enzyme|tara:strand:- start:1687 stop:1899 length:213 start_codon:yes stop_codon:yes gene_type:complete
MFLSNNILKAELKATIQSKEVISLLDFVAHKLDKNIKETVKQSIEVLEVIESEEFLSSSPTSSIEEDIFV